MPADSDNVIRRESRFNKTIDGQGLKRLIEASLTWLRTNQQIVNSLNVFPVPDGDTGTNMVLTMQAAYNEISTSGEQNFGKMTHAVAHGALMGARGNSGVILSQIWRGFARSVDSIPTLDSPALVQALQAARDTAYKGVVRPVEGTILTVAKDIAAVWTIGQMLVELEEAVKSWTAKLVDNKETAVIKQMYKALSGIVSVVGTDATSERLQGMTRLEKLQAAVAGETTVEEINILIKQFQTMSMMHQVLRQRKIDNKPIPDTAEAMQQLIQVEGPKLLTKQQKQKIAKTQAKNLTRRR